jgi:SAM-dependent methyltransferase
MTNKMETKGVAMGWMPPVCYDLLLGIFTQGRETMLRREILDLAEIAQGDHVLDCGCGTGSTALLASDYCGESGIVFGIDATPSFLASAKKKAASQHKLNVSFQEGLAESIPVSDNSFDVLVCTFTFHHLPGDEIQNKVLDEMKRVLKPGGRLLIVDFPGGSLHDHRHHHMSCCRHDKDELDVQKDPLFQKIEKAGFDDVAGRQVRMMGAIAFTARTHPGFTPSPDLL